MKIGFIGAGKVGFSLGKYLQNNCSQNDVEIVGYFSKSLKSAKSAADFTSTKLYINLENILKDSDTLFLTVPDGSISQIWDYMRNLDIRNKNICHCSGLISHQLFSDAQNKAMHILYPPTLERQIGMKLIKIYKQAYLTIEGNSILELNDADFQKCGGNESLKSIRKRKYYNMLVQWLVI